MSLKKLHEEVLNETKKLLKTDISTNPHTLNSYKINLKLNLMTTYYTSIQFGIQSMEKQNLHCKIK